MSDQIRYSEASTQPGEHTGHWYTAWVRRYAASAAYLHWQERLVRNMLFAASVVAMPLMVWTFFNTWRRGDLWNLPIYFSAYGLLLLATFLPRLALEVRAGILIALAYGLGILDLVVSGQGGDGRVFMLAGLVFVIIFLGRRAGNVSQIANILVMIVFAWAYVSGRLNARQPNDLSFLVWGMNALVLAVLDLLLASAINLILSHLSVALDQNQVLGRSLEARDERQRNQATELEMAHAQLSVRSVAVDLAAEVAREVAAVTTQIRYTAETDPGSQRHDLEGVLTHLVSLIGERLGFYHVGVFLVDPTGRWAELCAASSPGGRRMMARRHRLRVGQEGIVGYVARYGEPRVATDVGADVVHFANPDLPETRSEMAVPLCDQGQVLGVLDIQSAELNAFGDADRQEDLPSAQVCAMYTAIFQTLSDLMVVVIQNLRLYAQVQGGGAAEQRTVDQLSSEAWLARIRQGRHIGYRYDGRGVMRLDLPDSFPGAEGVAPGKIQTEKAASAQGTSTTEGEIEWVRPVSVRGHVIGEIRAHKPGEAGEWTPGEIELMETLVDQLDVALESARLYEDTQDRAARDRLIRETTGRMRESLDIKTVLQVALKELHESLGLAALDIRLHTAEAQEDAVSETSG